MSIPGEVQTDLNLYTLNNQLLGLRTNFAEAVSKLESKTYSIKKTFRTLYDNLMETLDRLIDGVEIAIVPMERFTDFENNLVTLDEFGSFEILEYYNGLQKLKLGYQGIYVAILRIQDIKEVPMTPANNQDSGILDSLNTEEFIEQGYANPVFELDKHKTYYTIIEGDTLQSIATKVYDGDMSRWPDIARENKINDGDLLGNAMLGETILIPMGPASQSSIANNLVYETAFEGTNQKQIDRYTYGRDIDLFKKRMQVDSTNDIKVVEGIPGVIQNIKDRFDNSRGSLNPLHPDWGISPPSNDGAIPFHVSVDRLLEEMEAQCVSDNRVLDAVALRRSVKLIRDYLQVEMEIQLIGGQVEKDNFNLPEV
jgi:hypothetical protein